MAVPLQTIVPLKKASNPIDYDSQLLLLGSCFVENIGKKLEYFKFRNIQNPLGILFHPIALERLVERALDQQQYQENEVFERDGLWYCFDAHSEIRGETKADLLEELNEALMKTSEQLQKASHIIITLGTSWVYELNSTNTVVANCHKVPQNQFTKKLLTASTTQTCLENIINRVRTVNPDVQFILTVSPVRHLKDGFVENQRSKANLITAIHQMLSFQDRSKRVNYFPAYEIMMDELRDYRFFEKDMVHPNTLAVDYVWGKFKTTWINPSAYELMDEVEQIQKGLRHRPFNPMSDAHAKFQKALQAKIAYLQEKLPFVKFQ